jgi:predicted AAA+ superfamily ATPase
VAITNQERIGKALDLLKDGLQPFVERELKEQDAQGWLDIARRSVSDPQTKMFADGAAPRWDTAALLAVLWNEWNSIFRKTLGSSERTLVSELRDVRNRWAHQQQFSSDDTDRALDSAARLLMAVSAPQADEVTKAKQELRRLVYDEQVRGEKRKAGGSLVDSAASGSLKPWRDIVTPHPDVAGGRYQQAEFAADLWQVYLNQGSDEYRDPVEFFRRTYLTESLKGLLVNAVQRISAKGGDPVVQLQTNFGGGKTHSMLGLYHLFSGTAAGKLAGVDALLAQSHVEKLPTARRIVLVGNRISPGSPVTKSDGTVVRTLWGEMAYQMGGKKAFACMRADDERATSPGDVLRQLLVEYGPCLVLIDEWVAYARQLHDGSDLPGGSFETMFTFAQALSESVKLAGNSLLVVSLPASDTPGSPHAQVDDVEVGGIRGREALDRLRNVVGRLESSWRPATAEEGFEIVRRRLFEPLPGAESFKQRDVTARAFADLYRAQAAEFPPDCRTADYERRIQAAFPIHPEIFDRLYTDWSTLVKFQRTRGVLRLMAAVIHCLWERGDHSPLILPSTVPMDDPRVQSELTRYLSDNWAPIIERDVDGPNSLPLQLDRDVSTLGKVHATRRVARTVYLGSAPIATAAHRGIEDRSIKLGCVMPGESPAVFGDALRRLASTATYLYQDGSRFWYSTQPTVTKLAEDRAEQLTREADKVAEELDRRLRLDVANRGDFLRVHLLPSSPADVPDDFDARLVVLTPEAPHSKDTESPALDAARKVLESRGTSPRLYRNTLVFLAADKVRLQDLDEAARKYLAWESILGEKDDLNLDPHQVRQAETQKRAADTTVEVRLPETYQWLLIPTQTNPSEESTWECIRLTGSEALAVRASRKLRSADALVVTLAPTILRKHLDDVPLWRGDSVSVHQVVEDFASYPYLPRLQSPAVLEEAIRQGLAPLTWRLDTFAFADSYDATEKRYKVLRAGRVIDVARDSTGLLVKPDVASAQLEREAVPPNPPIPGGDGVAPNSSSEGGDSNGPGVDTAAPPVHALLRRYHGTAALDPSRVGRDAARIAEEIIAHLVGVPGAKVSVTLEISANMEGGASEQLRRTVNENSRALKFVSSRFEEE